MARVVLWLAPACVALLCGAGPSGAEQGDRLAAALRARPLRNAHVGALLVRLEDGAVLFEQASDRPLIPASNQKILTAIAALDTFGPTHQFETRIWIPGPLGAGGVVEGLAVQGGGDPAMNSEDWWRLAADLQRAGLREVRGDIVVDDSVFDREYWHPDWGRVSARAYHAPVGGLVANYGAFFVHVRPALAPGESATVAVDPPIPFLRVVNLTKTVKSGERTRIAVAHAGMDESGEVVKVTGSIAVDAKPKAVPRSVRQPARYAGEVLKMQLEAVGVRVLGGVRRGGLAGFPEELWVHRGRTLAEIVRLFVKYSNNSIAESLVKSMGARGDGGPGSWSAGLEAMKQSLVGLGLDAGSLRLVDGSGLSTRNRATPRSLVQALRLARRSFDFGVELQAALPIAALDGTLEKRARAVQGDVRAKTGLLSRPPVTGLSGYLRMADGSQAVFSILVNDFEGGAQDAMEAVDGWVAAAAQGGSRPTTRDTASPVLAPGSIRRAAVDP